MGFCVSQMTCIGMITIALLLGCIFISGLAGDAHFDDAESFTTQTRNGINLDFVALHEFGHSVGLAHSNIQSAVMYPWYRGYLPNIALDADDISGIQRLYGKGMVIIQAPVIVITIIITVIIITLSSSL